MNWLKQISHTQIVGKALKEIMRAYRSHNPPLKRHIQYGMYPQSLVIWLLFPSRDQMRAAEASGLCHKIRGELFTALRNAGYPANGDIQIVFDGEDDIQSDGSNYVFNS